MYEPISLPESDMSAEDAERVRALGRLLVAAHEAERHATGGLDATLQASSALVARDPVAGLMAALRLRKHLADEVAELSRRLDEAQQLLQTAEVSLDEIEGLVAG